MIAPKVPDNENERLRNLQSYNILDTFPEQQYDDITTIASQICNTPISLITLVDKNRQWFKSRVGLGATETSREYAFCAHAINEPDQLFEVKNSFEDKRFHDNPLVTGEPRVIFYAGVPLVNSAGFSLGTLCVIDHEPRSLNDQQKETLKALSRQVISQLELRKKNIQLEEELKLKEERETELIRLKDLAEKSIVAKEEFLSNMSHEIRTPLNAVIGMTHLLIENNPREDQIAKLNTLHFAGENLLALVNDILDYNKIEAGKVNFENIPFNIIEITQNLKQAFIFKAEEKGVALKLFIDSDIPELIKGDPTRLVQLLNNLLGNALKFTQKGKVCLSIEILEENPDNLLLRFKVKDTGIGISKEQIDKIFERFSQANESTTRKYGGTGLGLSIVKKLLELQNSKIEISSQPEQGSCFSFDLRFDKVNEESAFVMNYKKKEQFPNSNKSAYDLSGIKVLLAEDNSINQIIASEFLKNWNVEIDYAVNGLEAVNKVIENDYDLILMDIQMPEMDGFEAAKKIKELGGTKAEIPILAMTASAMLGVRNKLHSFGMKDHILKPFNPKELNSKLAKYTRKIKH
ncbi:GAF domain-containing hybrid sensor histidine kinase/response regulator [Chondrinema litorale]|uniref:GAF domain-containing hybrid sensor histidine kinase/response regulator n=1 Tax=Chondrinema litorale TaxID=2994555 RepID=UPI0025434BE7|nr:ATP-binding protein [Chondrinema litorale]UZR93488.1 ATP-binding protein [Chondrinema litorale]